ncbi:hypothetical protein Vadar_030624 [Vaccinium darrowii]|uniref:Uncharacterized protein n=1 Tax=Vaccinium darrowii TaxID=229202 RepID=A0ACB7ZNZ8_9ERIC|nr:hypothetical protein Vadar_030624 [Vaccinium darrowii]
MESAFQSPTSSSIPETFVDMSCDQATSGGSVDSPRKRIRGKKAEKESRNKQKVADGVNSRFCNLMEQFNTHNEEIDKEKKELAERKVRVLEEMQKMEEKKEDDAIMSMDISGMDPQAQAYYSMRKNEVMAKIMARADCYRPLPPDDFDL